ncbi:hypothetical protein AQUCO_35100001v1 [Aquilegia coerulea]|uniref:Ribosomal protein L34e superfamily protein n=1 Tax=Aquilegia coerulea TaxID=218851 RepID=A0A2G5C0G6_AQUCA|nr:hypothetical protein AQUCO_35100001v1 [Aquilegia coerulea]
MLHPLTSITTMPTSSSSSHHHHHHHHHHSSKPNHRKLSSTNPNSNNGNPNSSTFLCKHSPSATLDILILILVLFSCTFLIISYFTYIFQSLSQILPPLFLSHSSSFHQFPVFYILGFLIFFTISIVTVEICFSYRSRKCEKPGCKGLKKALEFDIKLETEESLKKSETSSSSLSKEIDSLPWKGGTPSNPDYECLRSELRKMAPPNGRAVLLFRAKCGCPVAKLEAWGAKRGRKHKK